MKRFFKKPLFMALFFALFICCNDNDEPTPASDDKPTLTPTEPESIDSSCDLKVVYRDSKNSNRISTSYVNDGYGSDTVEYREYADSSLVYYMTFEYNSQTQVTLAKRFDMNGVLGSEQSTEYWPTGKKKMTKVVRKKLETLYDKTNTTQESYFDENGKIIEYKNLNNSGSLMNHVVYTNTYDEGKLVKAIRDDLFYNYDAIVEYSYNSDGLIDEMVTKNMSEEVTARTKYEYGEGINEVKRYSSDGTVLIGSEKFFRDENDKILKTQSLEADGSIRNEHHYSYKCSN
ncbi:hypothetical protein [Fulvivirga sediminis]|uniref:DUF4595 domain-containing protein n=1 Tax=Fulvivirga sediminis TaxID=2803949 RepID=A0A937F8I3_9BACT|nr:hypothetical protein [Fulvivirga sediminis]MBL3658427.1 hypothetical protein [Fulvivirga sediminis]